MVRVPCPRRLAVAMLAGLLVACGQSAPVAEPVDQPPTTDPSPDPNPDPPVPGGPYVSAHAGGTGHAPDESMLAFENAVRLGVDELEMDTILTADGVLVLIHDETLDRTTDCSGNISEINHADFADCDAAYWWEPAEANTQHRSEREHPLRGQGVRIERVEDVFAWIAQMGEDAPRVNIEIKIEGDELPPTGNAIAEALVSLIQATGLKHKFVVQSFLPTALDLVKLRDPDIRTSFLVGQVGATLCTNGVLYATLMGHDIVSPEYVISDLDLCVSIAQAAGLEVLPWTVDREEDMRRMIDLGVDGVITNYPACLLNLLGRDLPGQWLTPALVQPAGFPMCAE